MDRREWGVHKVATSWSSSEQPLDIRAKRVGSSGEVLDMEVLSITLELNTTLEGMGSPGWTHYGPCPDHPVPYGTKAIPSQPCSPGNGVAPEGRNRRSTGTFLPEVV